MNAGQIVEELRRYYGQNPCGGNLHIVADDENVEDEHVAFCLRLCQDNEDRNGEQIATSLLELDVEGRRAIVERYEEYA